MAETDGGPFAAAVIEIETGRLVALATNRVTATPDPTAHSEIATLRAAAAALDGTVLIASCEPCPMCLAACLWARVEAVVFLASRRDAAAVGFDDEVFHAALGSPSALPPTIAGMRVFRLDHPRVREPFGAWSANADRIPY
ncbi:MAG TPA: nucleoside deaminase [Actinomycetes bacterium]